MTEQELMDLKAELSVGSTVIDNGDDRDEPNQVGIIVTPNHNEAYEGTRGLCGFDEDPTDYVMVEWAWADAQTEVVDRCWEFVGHLRKF